MSFDSHHVVSRVVVLPAMAQEIHSASRRCFRPSAGPAWAALTGRSHAGFRRWWPLSATVENW